MAKFDLKSKLAAFRAGGLAITSDTSTASMSFDTADYDLGVMFTVAATDYTDGNYQLVLQESDDDIVFTDVPVEKIIGSADDITAATANGGTLSRLGLFSNDRYVRVNVVSTGVSTGANLEVSFIGRAELHPV